MQFIEETFLTLPMPFVWLFAIGLLLWSRPVASRRLIVLAAAGFVLSSFSVVGKLALLALLTTVPVWGRGESPKPVAIVVPTGGIFSDETGKWWPASSSIRRATAAVRLRAELNVPVILIGGSPVDGQPPEAKVIAKELGLAPPGVIVESTARNSMETGPALALILRDLPVGPVLLVTSEMHVARMGAVLRRAGLSVRQTAQHLEAVERVAWTDFIPSTLGLAYSAQLSRELWAILWYIVRGHVRPSDFG